MFAGETLFTVTSVEIDLNPETSEENDSLITGSGTEIGTGEGLVEYLWKVNQPDGTEITSKILSTNMFKGTSSISEYTSFPTASPGDYSAHIEIISPITSPVVLSNKENYKVVADETPEIAWVSTTSQSDENEEIIAVDLSLTHESRKAVSVKYRVTGTANGNGEDYKLKDDTVTFPPGKTNKQISLNIVDDILIEPDETVILTLFKPVNATLGENIVYTHTILNDDLPQIQFVSDSSSVKETETNWSIPVSLSPASIEEVSVDYSVTGGTATADEDFELTNGTLTLAANETSASIDVSIFLDDLIEDNETVVIELADPINASRGLSSHTLTIQNDDTDGQLWVNFGALKSKGEQCLS